MAPSTASRDLVEKMQTLRQCEVPHYWVVDPERETLTVYRPGVWLPCAFVPRQGSPWTSLP